MQTIIYTNPTLQLCLEYHNIETYAPAYNGESAGLDLYHASTESLTINPHETKLLPTGLHLALTRQQVALVRERGSVVKRPHLLLRAGVIDSGYTDEVFVAVTNISDEPVTIPEFDKLPFQLVVTWVYNSFNVLSDKSTYYTYTKNANRKEGKVGSSD